MKISLFIADFSGDGAERVLVNLARELNDKGHDIEMVIGNVQDPVFLKDLPASVGIVDLKVGRMLKSLPSLTKYLRSRQPDVMMATLVHSCCLAVLANILTGSKTRIVLREANTVSSDLRQYSWKRKMVMNLSVKTLYPLSNAIIGVSKGVVNDLKKKLPGSGKRIHLVYSPIISDDLFIKAAQKLDHPWFEDNAVPVILTVGRLTRQKRFDILIKAFATVRQKIDARLVILGEGELRSDLENLIAEYNLNNDVQLYGFDPNPFKFMSHARLFVLSSDWEGLPGVLIQAMACGCPVVSMDCPSGPRDILKDGRLGKLVPVSDMEALATAMEEALNQKPLRASQEDLSEYTVKNATANYLRIFDTARRVS